MNWNIWLSKNFIIKLNKNEHIDINLKFSDKLSRPSKSLVDVDEYKKLINTKNKINNEKDWDKYSKINNPYEKIPKIAKPAIKLDINRAFFKLYEILRIFEIKNINTSLHLCEAPGSFIQATLKLFPNVDWYAQSLYSDLQIHKTLDIKNRWIKGGDNTGDLCNINNILAINKKADLITADGGFDVSYDYNNQEQISFNLIFSEIFTALNNQNIGGSFICKIFDTFTTSTTQLIYMLNSFYTNVYIIKPRTSRFTNSEKYIVCINFLGISQEILDKLAEFYKQNKCCTEIFNNKVDYSQFYNYNNLLIENQIKYIELSLASKNYNSDYFSYMETIQNNLASEYCFAFFDIKYNKCKHPSLSTTSTCEMCGKYVIY